MLVKFNDNTEAHVSKEAAAELFKAGVAKPATHNAARDMCYARHEASMREAARGSKFVPLDDAIAAGPRLVRDYYECCVKDKYISR